eukprot:maker-scaffold421_size176100-snap-gene-0.25 protein:Tk10555 transcript:maker-scaffold421_size176100-snap-gene-0.25-mRNA-1 annotation:"hypothetical protein DAPPUDRAFT_300097"
MISWPSLIVSTLFLSIGRSQDPELWPHCVKEELGCPLPICPDCTLVDCIPEIKAEDCKPGTIFEENLVFGSCCPACVEYIERGDECFYPGVVSNVTLYENTIPLQCSLTNERVLDLTITRNNGKDVPVVRRNECQQQVDCIAGLCQIGKPADAKGCLAKALTYEDWLVAIEKDCKIMEWEPRCNYYGSFEAVQSKTNVYHTVDRKFCSNPKGERIFGEAGSEVEFEDMNCACSRKYWELTQTIRDTIGREDVSLHCELNGDFEGIQCDMDRCWCVNPETGAALTKPLHLNMARALPCYDEELFGPQYFRRCESRKVGKARARKKLLDHGFRWEETNEINCEWDGSFEKVYCDKEAGQCRCVDKKNQQIGNYFTSFVDRDTMNCQCARDELAGLTQRNCGTGPDAGNYREVQSFSESEYCVDEDGFRKTPYYTKQSGEICSIANCESRKLQCQSGEDDTCVACPSDCSG